MIGQDQSAPPSPDFSDEEPTVVIPRITTREIVTLDPDGHYARARGKAGAMERAA
jgi:hypothetical protein